MNFWLFILSLFIIFVIWDLIDSFMAYRFGVDKKAEQKKRLEDKKKKEKER